jgi:hypothetical protein
MADMPGRGRRAVRPGEEHQVAGLLLSYGHPRAGTAGPLFLGGALGRDTCGSPGHHHQPGAVEAARPRPSPAVGAAKLGFGVADRCQRIHVARWSHTLDSRACATVLLVVQMGAPKQATPTITTLLTLIREATTGDPCAAGYARPHCAERRFQTPGQVPSAASDHLDRRGHAHSSAASTRASPGTGGGPV